MINTLQILQDELLSWGELIVSLLPNLVLALLIGFITIVSAKNIRKIIYRRVKQSDLKDTLNTLLSTTGYIVVILIGGFLILETLQLDKAVTSLLAGAGIIGIALAFAFQEIASNYVSGIIIAVKELFSVGDLVETNGCFGTVQTIDLRTTTIHTLKGQIVSIPNSNILSNPLENYSESKERRVDIECGVSYDDDLDHAKNIAKASLEDLDVVNESKEVDFFYNEFGGSSINFVLRFWISFDQSNKPFLEAQSDAIEALKTAFDDEDIDIPYPIRTIDANESTANALRSE
jgi:small conductance mechanosensitive channel